jgi:hypothetical protein
MSKALWFILILAISACGAATQGAAAMLGDAKVAFRAERTVTVNGRRYAGILVHSPGHQRHEQDLLGMHEVFLLDIAAARGFLVLPGLKTYVEFPFPALMAELDAPDLVQSPAGEETIAGIRTTKYRVDHRAKDGSRAQGFAWVSRAGILMKLDVEVTRAHGGKPIAIALELSNLQMGPQEPHQFDLPAGYSRLPGDALGPLLGGNPG